MAGEYKADGFSSLEGGTDAGITPSKIDPNKVAWAVNNSFRGGFSTNRPGYRRVDLNFSSETERGRFETGLFQGRSAYYPDTGGAKLCASISGRLWIIDLDTLNAADATSGGGQSDVIDHAYFVQAENFLILQNRQDPAQIFNGASTRISRGIPYGDVPTGGPMSYGRGRLWVARQNEYLGGDLVFSDGTRDSVIRFTENTFLNEGGAFAVPATGRSHSEITGMCFASNIDTALGEGDLMVFTRDDIFAFQAPIDRDVWKDLDYPIQRFALKGYGSLSHDSIAQLNSDVYYQSTDGFRSFVHARRDFESPYGNTAISGEVGPAFSFRTETLTHAASSVVWDNRILTTCLPYMTPRGIAHKWIASLDFDIVSGMYNKLPPAWDGVWDGLHVLSIVAVKHAGRERLFAFHVDGTNRIKLVEIQAGATSDEFGGRINRFIESRSMDCQTPMLCKELTGGDLFISSLSGTVKFKLDYRTDLSPCWNQWHEWSECAATENCDPPGCTPPSDVQKQRRSRVCLPRPDQTEDIPNQRMSGQGFEHQVRVTISGDAVLRKMRIVTTAIIDSVGDQIKTS